MATRSERLDAAFAAVDRADFLPEVERGHASFDSPITIGHDQTNSQPSTVRHMLELLDVEPGHKVLDVGSGSGWTTALLGYLVGPEGSVIGMELVPELVEFGSANLARYDFPWAQIAEAHEGELGSPADAPFDRILVSAMADKMPDALVAQLAAGGVMVIPVSGRMLRVTRTPEGKLEATKSGHYRFVPLR